MQGRLSAEDLVIATAIIGVDTLWGGDVMNPSGVGRFVADTWFSGLPLPPCYHDDIATRLRLNGGVLGRAVSDGEIIVYIETYAIHNSIATLKASRLAEMSLRTKYLDGLGRALEVMIKMALATRGLREPISYDEAVLAATGQLPREVNFNRERTRVRNLLDSIDEGPRQHGGDLVKAVDAWREKRLVKPERLAEISAQFVSKLDRLTVAHVLRHLPEPMRTVPRTNVTFQPIKNAHFSGSLNYLGRARHDDGTPKYEATYEINAGLQISEPEFEALIAHEVVPGHILNLALLHPISTTRGHGTSGSKLPSSRPAREPQRSRRGSPTTRSSSRTECTRSTRSRIQTFGSASSSPVSTTSPRLVSATSCTGCRQPRMW